MMFVRCLLVLFSFACAPALTRPEAAQDPSHAQGPEASLPEVGLVLANAHATPVEAWKEVERTEAPQYVCPMHPEVISKEPGRCPKCNMKLVQKKAEEPRHD